MLGCVHIIAVYFSLLLKTNDSCILRSSKAFEAHAEEETRHNTLWTYADDVHNDVHGNLRFSS